MLYSLVLCVGIGKDLRMLMCILGAMLGYFQSNTNIYKVDYWMQIQGMLSLRAIIALVQLFMVRNLI